jgi:hypothetical protein
MSNNWPGYMTIVLFIAITALGFALWVGGLLLVWLLLRMVGVSTDLWAMIESLSTALAAAAVFGAGFVAYRELSEVASTRHMDVANRLFQELNSPVNIEARRWIFQNLPANPEEGLRSMTPEGQAAVKQVLNSLDHVAFLTQAGWIPEELVMPWMHPMIAKSWEKLEPYVKHERTRRNEPYYYKNAGELAGRCHAWRARHLADSKVTWVEEAL